jgi:hypothetical protein
MIIDWGIIEKTSDETSIFVGRFIKSLSFILLFTTFVIAGLFNKTYQVPSLFARDLTFVCTLHRHRLNIARL